MKNTLLERLSTKEAVIGIIGLGYVGLPIALAYSEEGFQTIGFDINEELIKTLSNKQSLIKHIPSARVAAAIEDNLQVTNDFTRIAAVDAVILCLPTPIGIHQEPILDYVTDSLDSLIPYLKTPVAISLESTTYPGTVEEVIVPRLEEAGYRIGETAFAIYSPEREDPGRETHTTRTVPKLYSGVTDACITVGEALYKPVIDELIAASSPKVAEAAKLLENIYRSVNIGLVNEMKMLTDKMGIDIFEVINAAATKPYGFQPFYPGPGIGGHCIPVDPFFLTWKAREYGVDTRFIEIAGRINSQMPVWVVQKITEAFNKRGNHLKDANILLLGMAYKQNVDDMRESPSLVVLDLLMEHGANIRYHDPFIPQLPKTRKYNKDMSGVDLTKEILHQVDCVVLLTKHDNVDYDLILNEAKLIIDTRGHFPNDAANVVRA